MKNLFNLLLVASMLFVLTGCCCPCAKMHGGQPSEQKPAETQPAEQPKQ